MMCLSFLIMRIHDIIKIPYLLKEIWETYLIPYLLKEKWETSALRSTPHLPSLWLYPREFLFPVPRTNFQLGSANRRHQKEVGGCVKGKQNPCISLCLSLCLCLPPSLLGDRYDSNWASSVIPDQARYPCLTGSSYHQAYLKWFALVNVAPGIRQYRLFSSAVQLKSDSDFVFSLISELPYYI